MDKRESLNKSYMQTFVIPKGKELDEISQMMRSSVNKKTFAKELIDEASDLHNKAWSMITALIPDEFKADGVSLSFNVMKGSITATDEKEPPTE